VKGMEKIEIERGEEMSERTGNGKQEEMKKNESVRKTKRQKK